MAGGTGLAHVVDTGPRALAVAVALAACLRFFRWLIEFVTARMDVGHARLGRRLSHVEFELGLYREATIKLVAALAAESPANAVLADVAKLLASIPPRPSLDLDELTARLNAIPGKGGK